MGRVLWGATFIKILLAAPDYFPDGITRGRASGGRWTQNFFFTSDW